MLTRKSGLRRKAKGTKSSLCRKLDKIVSLIVRARGKCETCGKKENLQCCHIFSRKFNNTRWDLDNLLCLCAGCHFMTHAEPLYFGEFVKRILGGEKYELLKEKHNQITKYTLEDLQVKLSVLEALLKTEGEDV